MVDSLETATVKSANSQSAFQSVSSAMTGSVAVSLSWASLSQSMKQSLRVFARIRGAASGFGFECSCRNRIGGPSMTY